MRINGTILKILKEYYTENVAYIKNDNELSKLITLKATKHFNFSPIVFNIYLERNSRSLEEELPKIGSGNRRK